MFLFPEWETKSWYFLWFTQLSIIFEQASFEIHHTNINSLLWKMRHSLLYVKMNTQIELANISVQCHTHMPHENKINKKERRKNNEKNRLKGTASAWIICMNALRYIRIYKSNATIYMHAHIWHTDAHI